MPPPQKGHKGRQDLAAAQASRSGPLLISGEDEGENEDISKALIVQAAAQ